MKELNLNEMKNVCGGDGNPPSNSGVQQTWNELTASSGIVAGIAGVVCPPAAVFFGLCGAIFGLGALGTCPPGTVDNESLSSFNPPGS